MPHTQFRMMRYNAMLIQLALLMFTSSHVAALPVGIATTNATVEQDTNITGLGPRAFTTTATLGPRTVSSPNTSSLITATSADTDDVIEVGRCGANVLGGVPGTGKHCSASGPNPCCSNQNWCGSSAEHCGEGMQKEYSYAKQVIEAGQCGDPANVIMGVAGTGKYCSVNGPNPCCSSSNWCGSSAEHCRTSSDPERPGIQMEYSYAKNSSKPTPCIINEDTGTCKITPKRPTFFLHGVKDNAHAGRTLRKNIATCTHTAWDAENEACADFLLMPLYEDDDSYKTNIRQQAADIIDYIQRKVSASPSRYWDGYNLVCHSQGGVICRMVVEIWDKHNVKSFISLAGPQMGVQGYENIQDYVPQWAKYIIDQSIYAKWVQDKYSFANYWHDRNLGEKAYQRGSRGLAPMNNEAPWEGRCYRKYFGPIPTTCEKVDPDNWTPGAGVCRWQGPLAGCAIEGGTSAYNLNHNFKTNFDRLEHAVFLGSPKDEAIVPWQSTQWGFYGLGGNTEYLKYVVPLEEMPVYKHDLLPIKKMMADGRFELHAEDDGECCSHTAWIRSAHGPRMMNKYYGKHL